MKNKTKTRKLSANYMDLVFTKNAEIQWRVKEDGLVEVDMENKGFFNSLAQKFFYFIFDSVYASYCFRTTVL